MTYMHEQIIQALAIIKTTCSESYDCDSCPLRKGNSDCYINNDCDLYPNEWDIMDEKNWRAFH